MTHSHLAKTSSLALFLFWAAGCGGAAMAPKAAEAPAAPGYAGDEMVTATGAAPMAEAEVAEEPMAAAPAEARDEAIPMAAPMAPAPPPPPPPSMPSRGVALEGSASGGVAKMAPPPRPAPTGARPVESMPLMMQSASVKAGEWDDNANYREFQKWLATEQGRPFRAVDVRDRQFIVVRDVNGKAVPNCQVTVSDSDQHQITLTTTASGRALLFPHAEGLSGKSFTAQTRCQNSTATARVSLDQSDGIVDLKLSAARALPATIDVDLAFVLDTTGSMSEEIAAVKSTIQKVASSLSTSNVRVRMGLVEFKDRTDNLVTRVYPMTNDIGRFSGQVSAIQASGGGDTPEAVNEGLRAGLTQLAWSDKATLRLAFLVGDAPPHLDYANDVGYEVTMRDAAHRGIQLFTIAASGMDDLGQVVWRQIAQYTGASNLFVLRGGAGPQSTGAGDPKSSCGGTQTAYRSGNLDALILQKIQREIRGLERDPLKIPGVRVDENAKPCKERLMLAE